MYYLNDTQIVIYAPQNKKSLTTQEGKNKRTSQLSPRKQLSYKSLTFTRLHVTASGCAHAF